MTGLWVLVGVLALATALGLAWRSRNGRVRGGTCARADTSALPDEVRALLSGRDVTLLQLSTTFCAPCRQARVLLSDLARNTAGLAHVELDLTERPELASQLHVLRTPTTLALDAEGNELLRIGGVPRRAELLDALRGSRSIP